MVEQREGRPGYLADARQRRLQEQRLAAWARKEKQKAAAVQQPIEVFPASPAIQNPPQVEALHTSQSETPPADGERKRDGRPRLSDAEKKQRRAEQNKRYFQANRERLREERRAYKKRYYEQNRERYAELRRQSYQARREEQVERQRRYREANRDTLRERSYRSYYAQREEKTAAHRRDYQLHREQRLAYQRAYYRQNKEKISERAHDRYLEKKAQSAQKQPLQVFPPSQQP